MVRMGLQWFGTVREDHLAHFVVDRFVRLAEFTSGLQHLVVFPFSLAQGLCPRRETMAQTQEERYGWERAKRTSSFECRTLCSSTRRSLAALKKFRTMLISRSLCSGVAASSSRGNDCWLSHIERGERGMQVRKRRKASEARPGKDWASMPQFDGSDVFRGRCPKHPHRWLW